MSYIAIGFEKQTEVVGNGQCVTLVKTLAHAPASSLWREGAKITEMLAAGRQIPSGTVIATFVRGRYLNLPHGNHAAIFIRYVAGGMEIFDQWLHHSPRKRIIFFKHARQAGVAQSAELYSVVQ